MSPVPTDVRTAAVDQQHRALRRIRIDLCKCCESGWTEPVDGTNVTSGVGDSPGSGRRAGAGLRLPARCPMALPGGSSMRLQFFEQGYVRLSGAFSAES